MNVYGVWCNTWIRRLGQSSPSSRKFRLSNSCESQFRGGEWWCSTAAAEVLVGFKWSSGQMLGWNQSPVETYGGAACQGPSANWKGPRQFEHPCFPVSRPLQGPELTFPHPRLLFFFPLFPTQHPRNNQGNSFFWPQTWMVSSASPSRPAVPILLHCYFLG